MSIVITGAGAACATGTGCDALWDALSTGRDGLLPVKRFGVEEFKTRIAGLWPKWETQPPAGAAALELATVAAREALAQARVTETRRMAVLVGTCFAENLRGFSELAQRLAAAVGAGGPSFIVSTACSSSTTAIGLGRDLLERGEADVVLAGGVDVLTRAVFAGFHAIGVMAAEKCAPFGDPPGLTLGEGAGFVVLERAADARVRPLSSVLGYGLSADAHHETSPDPSGSGVRRAILAAFEDAGVDSVDVVSAHGTGTDSNDAAEWRGIQSTVHPERSAKRGVEGRSETAIPGGAPLTATKSFLGHAQGAAGVLELIALLECMKRGVVPPTLRAQPRRAGITADVVTELRPLKVRRALKLSAAFGGANAALIVGEGERRSLPERRRVYVAGISAIGSHGLTVAALENARLTGSPPPFELSDLVRAAPERDLDPSGRYCTAAVALALDDAKLSIRGAARERSGLFLGSTRMPPKSVSDTQLSMDKRGPLGVAAVPFTHMVLNAPAGKAAKLLSLKGPLLALSSGACSGLFAIARAAEHLAARRCADVLVAGGLDELPVKDADGLAEGAAFAALMHEPRGVELLGWGLAGPNDVERAISAAMERCPEVDGVITTVPVPELRVPLGVQNVAELYGAAEATASAYAFVLAVARVRSGPARRLLVVSASPSLSCAVVVGGSNGL